MLSAAMKMLLPLAASPLSAVTNNSCTIISTSLSTNILLRGTVLTSHGALQNSAVLVSDGKIACVGSSCGTVPQPDDVTVVDCPGSVISPGFINTHEHLSYSTLAPFEDIGQRTNHRHDWRWGSRGFTMRPAHVNGTVADATAWGELRHIFSGTTSIVGEDMVPGLARNLDFVTGLEAGIGVPVATWDVFPLDDGDDLGDGVFRHGDCDYGPGMITKEKAGKFYRYMAHIGEGIDAEAANEFRCLSDPTFDTTPQVGGGGLSTDIIAPNLALVHALGLTEADFDLVAKRGATVVWSPRSNVFLYGKTLNVTYLLEAGIKVALGTDWQPSGSATMPREASCGFSATQKSYGITLDTKTIWEMMTINAAEVAGFEKHLGSLEVGKLADIVIISGSEENPFAQAVFSGSENIDLVMRGGKILLADSSIEDVTTGSCEPAAFGNVNKIICVADELGKSFADLEASLEGVYPAILPGIPPFEPSCETTR